MSFDDFDGLLKALYAEFTFERAAEESQVPVERIRAAAEAVAAAGDRLATHNWRAASIGNKGGWQITRCLLFLNVLTGSIGTRGGTSGNSWNKFVPKSLQEAAGVQRLERAAPPPRVALRPLRDVVPPARTSSRRVAATSTSTSPASTTRCGSTPTASCGTGRSATTEKIKLHVALTPTWNESAWFADYVLPMGISGERHDLMSQETHAGQWIGFRQPVRRVAMERAGQTVQFTYEANPGEVWEENEFWVELTWRMDPDGSLGIRQWVESEKTPGEPVSQDEYWAWIFENSVPGLPEAAAAEGLEPLPYMRKYGCFEVKRDVYTPYAADLALPDGHTVDEGGTIRDAGGSPIGVMVDGGAKVGFNTPSRKLEFFSPTMRDWGWPEKEYAVPWPLESHVSSPDRTSTAARARCCCCRTSACRP